jgi:CTP synthase
MVELANHRFFIACQFHPEFKSKPNKPHPLFSHFVKAGLGYRNERGRSTGATAVTTQA